MTRAGLTDDAQYRAFTHGRIIFGDDAHQGAYQQTYANGSEDTPFGELSATQHHRFGQYKINQRHAGQGRQDDRPPVAHVQGFLYAGCVQVGCIADAHEQGTYNGEKDTDACDQHGEQDGGEASELILRLCLTTQYHGRQYRGYIRTEEVGAHSGYVPYVVTYVVGNGSRVAGIILWDACFHLTYQVSAYVSRLCINTATYTGEQCYGFGAQREACQYFDGPDHFLRIHRCLAGKDHFENDEQTTQTQHRQARYTQTHNRSAGERDLQCLAKAGTGSLRRTHIGPGCAAHADVTSGRAQHRAKNKGYCNSPVRVGVAETHYGQQDRGQNYKIGEYLPFRLEKGHGAFSDKSADLLHPVATGILLGDPGKFDKCVKKTDGAHHGNQINQFVHNKFGSVLNKDGKNRGKS